ncbi:hypothetical protein [Brachybacterium sp. ACRRE]|uniref:hypothetical protein n=1 Tax=Brachybacterium sp. ACRRE TaxID=2918184 RepID=UPI001EF20683|nr:hypothetical protein [Brachybacterium sp. ACRRE]MCG7309411.1 hypothetical protein [Brachybacterium sp. ACRRE]
MGNLPGWVIPVIILIIVVLAILIIVGVVSSRRRRARQEEIDRQRAAELRSQAQKDQVEVKEREIKARETELEADKAKVEAERRDQTAQQQRQDADRARADVDGRLRQADELDPDVDAKGSSGRRGSDAPLDETTARDAGDADPRADERRAPGHGVGAGAAGVGAAGVGAAASDEGYVDRTDRTEQRAGIDGATARHDAIPPEHVEDRPRDARTVDAAPREAAVNPAGTHDEQATRPDAHSESAPQPGSHAEHAVQPDARSERSTQPKPREAGAAQPGAAPRDQRVPEGAPEASESADGNRSQGRHEGDTRGAHRAPGESGHGAAAGGAGAAAGAGVAAGVHSGDAQAAQDQRTAQAPQNTGADRVHAGESRAEARPRARVANDGAAHREDAPAGTHREPLAGEQTEGRHQDARPVDGDASREGSLIADDGGTRRAQPVEAGAAAPASGTSRDADRQPGDADGHVLSEDEIDARANESSRGTDRSNAAPTAGDAAPRSGEAYEDPRGAVTPVQSPSADDRRAPRPADEADGRTLRPETDAEGRTSRPVDDSDPFSISESHVRRARGPREGDLDDGIEDTERGL